MEDFNCRNPASEVETFQNHLDQIVAEVNRVMSCLNVVELWQLLALVAMVFISTLSCPHRFGGSARGKDQ